MLGIIVGSGFYDYPGLEHQTIETKWGQAELGIGTINGSRVALVFRHGKNHHYLPHHINFRANIAALKKVGAKAIISCSVGGVLKANLPLATTYVIEDMYFPDNRLPDGSCCSLFDEPGHAERGHLLAGSLFNSSLQKALKDLFYGSKIGKYAYSIGPRFNTKTEIKHFAQLDLDIVSQTCGPEAVLANETEIPYALLTFGIDYANGVSETPTPIETLQANLAKSKNVFKKVVEDFSIPADCKFENFVYRFN